MELGILIAGAAAVWVYKDAKDRGSSSAVGWAIGVFMLLIVFLPLYLIKRPPKKLSEEMPYAAPQSNPMPMQAAPPTQQTPPVLPPQTQAAPTASAQQPQVSVPAPASAPTPTPAASPMPARKATQARPVHANAPTEKARLCPNCGQYYEQTMNFCPHCGTKNKA